jgi:hypothetical protein
MTHQRLTRTQQPAQPQESWLGNLFKRPVGQHEEAKSPDQPEAKTFRESRFQHDLSRIPVSSDDRVASPPKHRPSVIQPKLKVGAVGDRCGIVPGNRQVSLEEQYPNKTGLPDRLKTGIESLSGLAMDDVKVHYNSSKPLQLQALAYTQGTEIHVAPGEEQHLPHEAWHVVQQMQGRVQPTIQLRGQAANNEVRLEQEAERMGNRLAGRLTGDRSGLSEAPIQTQAVKSDTPVIQRRIYLDQSSRIPLTPHLARQHIKQGLEKRGLSSQAILLLEAQISKLITSYQNNQDKHITISEIVDELAPKEFVILVQEVETELERKAKEKEQQSISSQELALAQKQDRGFSPLELNPHILSALPQEAQTRVGAEIELSDYPLDRTPQVAEKDLKEMDSIWQKSVTIAWVKIGEKDAFEALDITFDGDSKTSMVLEVRLSPRTLAGLLTADKIQTILSTMTLLELGNSFARQLSFSDQTSLQVLWRPNPQWGKFLPLYKPKHDRPIRVDNWNNLQISHTLPIHAFLKLKPEQQGTLFPHIPKSGLRDVNDFFTHFGEKNLGEQGLTANRSKATPNIKSALDTLFQVFPYKSKQTKSVHETLKGLATREKLPVKGLYTQLKPTYFKEDLAEAQKTAYTPPQKQQRGTNKEHLSVEWKPWDPFYDPKKKDLRVLVEHRPNNPSPLWQAVQNQLLTGKTDPGIEKIFAALDALDDKDELDKN